MWLISYLDKEENSYFDSLLQIGMNYITKVTHIFLQEQYTFILQDQYIVLLNRITNTILKRQSPVYFKNSTVTFLKI